MPIITSSYNLEEPQIDGRSYCNEIHVDHTGLEHKIKYLADAGLDVNAVMQQRAIALGAAIDMRERVIAESVNFEIPLSQREFLDRFTVQERISVRQGAKTDPVIEDLLDYLNGGSVVYRNNPATGSGLDYLISVGILIATRKVEILA